MSALVGSITSALSAFNPLQFIGRKAFVSQLALIRHGKVTVILTNGEKLRFGGEFAPGPPIDTESVYHNLEATVKVFDDALWTRLLAGGDMGFAEGYMAGEVAVDDMTAFLIIIVVNKPYLEVMSTPMTLLNESLDVLRHSRLANTIKNAIWNISAHYDLSNDMFAAFLDSRMMYSSAIWDWTLGDRDTLDAAQLRKIDHVLAKAKLTPQTRVLEIGSGWGGLAIEAVRQSGGCSVVTITLSIEQKLMAEARIRAAEKAAEIPAGRIVVELCDYRKLPERYPAGSFDVLISIEMVEAVGRQYLATYFDICNRMLHPRRGIMVIQFIAMPETRYEAYARRCDFIQKYIFPGGHLPSPSLLVHTAAVASNGQLIVQNVESFATHYARTLQAWRARFEANYDSVAAKLPTVVPLSPTGSYSSGGGAGSVANKPNGIHHDDDSDGDDDGGYDYSAPSVVAAQGDLRKSAVDALKAAGGCRGSAADDFESIEGVRRRAEIGSPAFRRKFLYYFDYCTAGFVTRVIDVYQVVLSREGNERMLDGPYAQGDISSPF